jgi:elongation factor Ts
MEAIKKLREMTGAGMVDCKQALDEAGGDIDKAVEILRKKGIAKAAKREDRAASQGIIKIALNQDGTKGYMLEVNAETDFVAKNSNFQTFGDKVLALIQEQEPADLESLLSLPLDNGTVKEALDHLSGVIGEKLAIKRLAILSGACVGAYVHANGAIGVLVSLNQVNQAALARDIAMQVAAANPRYIRPEEVPAEELDKEKEVYREQLKKEGKPVEMIEKILTGKVNKYYEEVCLIRQEYIKDDKQKVEQILKGVAVDKFIRFSL